VLIQTIRKVDDIVVSDAICCKDQSINQSINQ